VQWVVASPVLYPRLLSIYAGHRAVLVGLATKRELGEVTVANEADTRGPWVRYLGRWAEATNEGDEPCPYVMVRKDALAHPPKIWHEDWKGEPTNVGYMTVDFGLHPSSTGPFAGETRFRLMAIFVQKDHLDYFRRHEDTVLVQAPLVVVIVDSGGGSHAGALAKNLAATLTNVGNASGVAYSLVLSRGDTAMFVKLPHDSPKGPLALFCPNATPHTRERGEGEQPALRLAIRQFAEAEHMDIPALWLGTSGKRTAEARAKRKLSANARQSMPKRRRQ